jgi:hypothetical protein
MMVVGKITAGHKNLIYPIESFSERAEGTVCNWVSDIGK